jgi:hypothetical protein
MPAQGIPEALGTYYASNHSTPSSSPTGIQKSIMLCGTTSPCTVIIPAGYGIEPVPGSNPNPGYAQPNSPGFVSPGSIPSNVTIIDQRGGGAATLQNNQSYAFSNVVAASLLNCSHSNSVPANANSVYCFDILHSANGGGSNYNYNYSPSLQLGGNLTNWAALQTTLFASTEGQAIASGVGSVHNGIGDTLGMSVSARLFVLRGVVGGECERCS